MTDKPSKIQNILVPLNGETVDEDVLTMACLLAKKYKARVCALHVIVVKQALPLDADQPRELQRGEEILLHAKKVCDSYGVPITLGEVQARLAGVAIVEEAAVQNADTIMMAVTNRKTLGDFDMGKTVPYVLKNAPCSVLLYRAALTGAEH